MNGLDLLIVLLAVVAAVGGWRLGFVRRGAAWAGAAIGLVIAVVVAPGLVDRLGLETDLSVLLVGTALLVLLASVGQGIGATIGAGLRARTESPTVQRFDSVGGTVLGLIGVMVLVWLVVPVMADAEGWPAAAARGSTLARLADRHLPAPPPQIAQLEAQLSSGGYPELFTGMDRAPDLPDAPSESGVSQEMLDRTARSVVRIQGPACERTQSGSGFFVADGLVATNAHVVAGTTSLELTTPDGAEAGGVVVALDPRTDLALVRTSLDRPALPIAEPDADERGLVMGFPGGGPFDPSPFLVGEVIEATGFDIYDRDLVKRELLTLASSLERGDSGSAVMREDGEVIGVAVAVAPDRPQVAYGLASSELTRVLDRERGSEVSTGDCTA